MFKKYTQYWHFHQVEKNLFTFSETYKKFFFIMSHKCGRSFATKLRKCDFICDALRAPHTVLDVRRHSSTIFIFCFCFGVVCSPLSNYRHLSIIDYASYRDCTRSASVFFSVISFKLIILLCLFIIWGLFCRSLGYWVCQCYLFWVCCAPLIPVCSEWNRPLIHLISQAPSSPSVMSEVWLYTSEREKRVKWTK